MRQLVEAAGRLVANRSVPGSGVTAPFRTSDNTGREEVSSEVITKSGAATMDMQGSLLCSDEHAVATRQ